MRSQRGTVLITLLILGTIIGIVLASLISLLLPALRDKLRTNTKSQLYYIVREIAQCVQDGPMWAFSVTAPSNPAALRCSSLPGGCANNTTGKFAAWAGPSNNPLNLCIAYYNPLVPTAGFRQNGMPCNTYSDAGNAQCPYRIELHYFARCRRGEAACTDPLEEIILETKYNPGPGAEYGVMNMSDGVDRTSMGFPRSSQTLAIWRGTNAPQLPVVLQERQPVGTPGGRCVPGRINVRKINYVQSDPGLAVAVDPAGGGGFLLRAGTYDCYISVPGYMVGKHNAYLSELSASAAPRVYVRGENAYSAPVFGYTQTSSSGSRRFRLTADTYMVLSQYCETEPAEPSLRTLAMGVPFGFGAEVYAQVSCLYQNVR